MRIVLDTNCLLRAVPAKSNFHCILEELYLGHFILCCSNEILTEYEELLMRFYGKDIAENVMNFIINSPYTEKNTPYYKWNLITSDFDDNKFVDCALNAGAEYIVTNDHHFDILKNISFPKIEVIGIETFKEIVLM
ncbi:MAG: putative toxin-antitoxin system toxin component, PIN family [Dysgonamonadaceae bacterium]|jgi:putative PIN family toxin of toxin-antitoxin system|nr:putative toxin-antitoxin system toxin component, PIN family [Dysgonamonadaceae bacterium]